jgi:flagellar biosynthesis chaperone FliJ
MNVQESERWLGDRTAELESAQGKLASLQAQLETAQSDFSRTNGNPAEFIKARDRVQHLEHQIEQTRQSIATCTENVRIATERLQSAQRESRIAELTAQRVARRERAATIARLALDAYEQLAEHLKTLDVLQQDDPADVSALRSLGAQTSPLQVTDVLLLELMTRHEGHIATAVMCNRDGYRAPQYHQATDQGLLSLVTPLFEVQPAGAQTVANVRESLGDSEMRKALPIHIDADRHIGVEWVQRDWGGFNYDTWLRAPDGRKEVRVLYNEAMPHFRQRGVDRVDIVSDETIDLDFEGQRGRLVKFSNGQFVLLAPPETQPEAPHEPSIVERATAAARDLANGALDKLIGTSAE